MTANTQTCAAEYALGRDVFLLPVEDGTARLLDMGGRFYAVPAIGAQMLQATLEQGTAAAVREIAAQFAVPPEQVKSDLANFLVELQRQGLVLSGPARQRWPTTNAGLAYWLLAPVLGCIHRLGASVTVRAWALLALTRLCFCLFGWGRTVAAWQRYHGPATGPRGEDDQAVTAIDDAVRRAAANHLFRVECKERALSCWALLRSAGLPAALVVGINFFPLAGHCWCEVGARLVSDDRDRCDAYRPVVRYV